MRSSVAKHLHPILGRRMVDWVVAAAEPLGPEPLVVVASPDTADAFEGLRVAVQERPLGTGDAVRAAREAVGDAEEVLVLSGDTPLLTTELLSSLVDAHRASGAAATVLSFVPDEIRSYGRIVRDEKGDLVAIVEAADASPEELAIREANSSIYVFGAEALWPALDELTPANAQGELYLTDAVRGVVASGGRVGVFVAPDPAETEGVNTRVELAAAGAALRERINREHMLAGVTIVDPATTWIDPTVTLEPDSIVHPFTVLRGATSVATGRRGRPARRRDRRHDWAARARRAVLLPSPRHRARGLGEGRHVRGAEEHRGRRGRQGATPVVHGRRRDRRPDERRRGIDHRELPARARPARRDAPSSGVTSGSPWTLCSLRRSQWETTRGQQPERS